ncbi:DNA mismatch repair endonuclease MutL [Paenibacillus alginolyticus]|uniref:DNA mismatch repair protein MutL n=1 Tax=Paenibacillus alginolyticus TaxID=59839 RepID=A0ABT4GFQ0_9BACL|nr:DNA mismatch repair endonuclease MutL [Paenibacillus alginolyticus]MCY9695021.1 DNA mismatch repair endonuclease MutL [Paenibacillus alginolyticus]MEC0145433.1 DNA mismatch repair endonuclease MutL [Paenibacillus alginolyticus]
MGKIQLLSEHIANQIAAGEVVERPSSVVKELVENSVDAGSTRIDVTIEEGGLQLIRVSDNGSGMALEDCELAFQRHATSKIATSKDLFSIRTLGFRGEALPSIASVSRLECVTSSTNDGLGRKISIEGGTIRSVEETAASRGTEVTVRELFYNTPARLKYMKTIQTELGHISDYLYRLALAHPGIAFSLKHNSNLLLQTLGNGDLLQVIAGIYGTAIGKQMLPLQVESLDYTITGFVAKPEMTRANRGGISTIVNGRYVRNFALNQALLQGYHTLLPINRYPVAVLHIGMDPALVDVNVHPSKLEVRFSKEAELTALIEAEVKRLFGRQVLIPQGMKPAAPKGAYVQEQLDLTRTVEPVSSTTPVASTTIPTPLPDSTIQRVFVDSDRMVMPQVKEAVTSYRPESVSTSRPPAAEPQRSSTAPTTSGSGASYSSRPSSPSNNSYPSPIGGNPRSTSIQQQRRTNEAFMDLLPSKQEGEAPMLPAFPRLDPIGQMHGTYLVAQNEEGLFLIDQHAAHERINYEYYYERFGNPAEASQELLVPITLEFTPSEAGIIAEKLSLFEQAGVYMEAFGGNTFLVRAHPHWFPSGEEKGIVEEMCEWVLSEKKAVDIAKLREKAAIMCSCKASIKANQGLSVLEMETLIDRLSGCRNPYTCPHGRPIVVSFTTYELEKMFKRVM